MNLLINLYGWSMVHYIYAMLCGSCTGRKCCFACDVKVFIVTNFCLCSVLTFIYSLCTIVGNGFGLLEKDFVCLTSDSFTNISLKPLHVVFLQLYNRVNYLIRTQSYETI